MLDRPLIQRNKRLARTLLYLSPLFFVAAAVLFIFVANRLGFDTSWSTKDFEKVESVQLFREYLMIDTSPTGSELAGAEWLARQLEPTGVEVHIERLGERNANLWAVLEGDSPEMLVLHHHIDTEPVFAPQEWQHPPYGGVIDPPFLFGRGAFDMKSLAIAQLLAFRDAAEDPAPRRYSLMFLATADEERGSWLGTRRWLPNHPELVSRIAAVLTEGGAVEALDLEDVKYWGTEFGQKYFVDVWVCDGSRERLEALRRQLLTQADGPLRPPTPEVAEFLRRYGPSRSRDDLRELLREPENMLENPPPGAITKRIKALLHNNLAVFRVQPDPGGGYRMRVILHLLPDTTFEEGWNELLPDGLHGFTHQVVVPHPPVPASSLDHPVYRGIEEYMAGALPGEPHGPLFIPWSATDARFFRSRGIPAYGFSPFLILTGDAVRVRGVNERMALPPFIDGVELYRGLVRHLLEPADAR